MARKKVLMQRVRMLKNYGTIKKGDEGYAVYRTENWGVPHYTIQFINKEYNYVNTIPRNRFEVLEPQEENSIIGEQIELIENIGSKFKKGDRLTVKDIDWGGNYHLTSEKGNTQPNYMKIKVLEPKNKSKPKENEDDLIGKKIRLRRNYSSLLAGSEGVVVAQKLKRKSIYALLVTKEKWDPAMGGGLHSCDNLIADNQGYWVDKDCMEIIGDEKNIDVDADYICSMMPWEIEELKSKEK